MRRNVNVTHLSIAGLLVGFLLIVSTCRLSDRDRVSTSRREFVGSGRCAECHASVAEAHARTAHARTSRPANPQTVKGDFNPGNNVFHLDNGLKIMMIKSDSGLYQIGLAGTTELDRERMDIVIGSGKKGQSYLYWKDQSLFQLPVSYYTPGDTWCNSPGYPSDQIVFNRSVSARCLECHSTNFRMGRSIAGRETFDPDEAMLGVDCERCHGPAADHVRFHLENIEETDGKYIVNPANLTRQQRLDNCALCHSGIRQNFLPSFSYVVGEKLDDYFFPEDLPDSVAALDVHGNQYGLLAASKCFRMSDMDCSSCHDVHSVEAGNTGLFSARCMSCHRPASDTFCSHVPMGGLVLADNCIDCHMPALPSRKVFLQAPSTHESTPFLIRTHYIATYPEQVKSFLERMATKDHSD